MDNNSKQKLHAKIWHLKQNNSQTGPYSTLEITKLIVQDKVNNQDLIYREGGNGWKLVSEVEPFNNVFSKKSNHQILHSYNDPTEELLLSLLGLYVLSKIWPNSNNSQADSPSNKHDYDSEHEYQEVCREEYEDEIALEADYDSDRDEYDEDIDDMGEDRLEGDFDGDCCDNQEFEDY